MELSFGSKTLRSLCSDSDKAERRYGPVVAAGLRTYVADLDAAVTVADLPSTGALLLTEDELRVFLGDGWCLVGEPGPPDEAGRVDWTRVYRLKLLRIETCDE